MHTSNLQVKFYKTEESVRFSCIYSKTTCSENLHSTKKNNLFEHGTNLKFQCYSRSVNQFDQFAMVTHSTL